MILFYSTQIENNTITLNESESLHCVKTLRHKKGDHIFITDTKGNLFKALIADPDSRETTAEIIEKVDFKIPDYNLHIAVAPTKNPDRMEWFIEKATEIGITEFTPIICRHSEKKHLNISRIERILIAAAKQSLKFFFPVVKPAIPFMQIIQDTTCRNKFIATCNSEIASKNIKDVYSKNDDALILIGPEGDFSIEEINAAIQNGFQPINLGKNRYRTETAAIIACAAIRFIND